MSRYTDLEGEPVKKMLTPITGYEKVSLFSLEEAVADIYNYFIDLNNYIYIAKNNCQDPEDNLSQDESASIYLYTMQFSNGSSLYQILNTHLRTADRNSLLPWHKYLKLFMTALFKLKPVSGTVWRAVRGQNISQLYPTGKKFAWWGVSSCTTTPDVFQKTAFLGKTGDRTLFSIECFNGKSIKNHSYFNELEKEIVLLPGTFLEVVGQVSPAEGLNIIHLKQIEPPFALLAPPFVDATQSTDLNALKRSSRTCQTSINSPVVALAGSNNDLLICTSEQLTLMNPDGRILFTVKHDIGIVDLCWSSHINQFLMISNNNTLHSFDIKTRQVQQLIQMKRMETRSCTAHANKLMISNYDHQSFIDVYDLNKNCEKIESYELPIVGKKNQYIELIRLNETYLGILLNQFEIKRNWFELRQPDNMSVLHSIDLTYHDNIHRVIVLPGNEYLIHAYDDEELTLLTDRISRRETIRTFLAEKRLSSIAFIDDRRCLVIQTLKKQELHFFDVKTK